MMSKVLLFIGALSMTTALQAATTMAVSPTTKDVSIAINEVYVPAGFDSDADSYVVISGIFPNGCYKWKGVTRSDISKLEHEITATATVNQGMCMMVLVPFSKDVRLGKLEKGTHLLRFMSNDGTFIEKTITVE